MISIDLSDMSPAAGFAMRDVSGGFQAEGDFSAASTSRRGLGGRPPSRSTSPVTMSNAPAAKLAWMPTTVLTSPAADPPAPVQRAVAVP